MRNMINVANFEPAYLALHRRGELKQRAIEALAGEIGPETYVNVMAQYHPAGKVNRDKYTEINLNVTTPEYETAVQLAGDLNLRLDERRSRAERR